MNKKVFFALSLSALLCVSQPSFGISIRGAIAQSCGVWVEESKQEMNVRKAGLRNAVMGYLSGLAVGTKMDILKNTDFDSVMLWVTNYCTANPLDKMVDASDALFRELMKREGIK